MFLFIIICVLSLDCGTRNESIDHFAPMQEAISDENESEQAQMLRSNAPLKTISNANVLIAALIIKKILILHPPQNHPPTVASSYWFPLGFGAPLWGSGCCLWPWRYVSCLVLLLAPSCRLVFLQRRRRRRYLLDRCSRSTWSTACCKI